MVFTDKYTKSMGGRNLTLICPENRKRVNTAQFTFCGRYEKHL